MHFVVRRTWLAGADPGGAPDLVRTAAVCLNRTAAEAKARALARSGREPRHDPQTGSWWMRTPDALHQLVVSRARARRAG